MRDVGLPTEPMRTGRELGLACQALRRRKGITQRDLAAMLGVSATWVSSFENARHGTNLQMVFRVLDVLGVEIVLRAAPPIPAHEREIIEMYSSEQDRL